MSDRQASGGADRAVLDSGIGHRAGVKGVGDDALSERDGANPRPVEDAARFVLHVVFVVVQLVHDVRLRQGARQGARRSVGFPVEDAVQSAPLGHVQRSAVHHFRISSESAQRAHRPLSIFDFADL